MMQGEGYERSWNDDGKRMCQKQKDNEAGLLLEHQDTQQIREKFRKYVADANSPNVIAKKASFPPNTPVITSVGTYR